MIYLAPWGLRLFLGSGISLVFFVALSSLILGRSAAFSSLPYLAIITPLAGGIACGLLLPDLNSLYRWRRIWAPMSQGKITVADQDRQRLFLRGLREITGPLTPASATLERTHNYVISWARTALQDRLRDEWIWRVYGLVWFALKHEKTIYHSIRALLLESVSLPDLAFELGLRMYPDGERDDELAQLLAKEGLRYNEEDLAPEYASRLERVWLRIYAKDVDSREEILPRLVRRFMNTQRRDAIAGRIYVDAFLADFRSPLLQEEMENIVSILQRMGRNPELTANLRALAKAHEIVVSAEIMDELVELKSDAKTILRPPKGWLEGLSEEDRKAFKVEISEEEKRETEESRIAAEASQHRFWIKADERFEEVFGEKAESTDKTERSGFSRVMQSVFRRRVQPKDASSLLRAAGLRARRLLIVAAGVTVIVILILSGVRRFGMRNGSPAEPPGLTLPGPVRSQQPYTIQVAAHRSQERAVRHLKSLRSSGVDAYFVVTSSEDKTFFRLRVGKFSNTGEAGVFADSLKTLGIIDDFYIVQFEPGEVPGDVQQ